jgi:hypothetical protein
MAKRLDIQELINTKYNSLILIKEVEPHITSGGHVHRKCLFKCDCGKVLEKQFSQVKNGSTKSCGCHSRKIASERMKKINTKHGKSKMPEYNVFLSMKKRCLSKDHKAYKNYGGRGILICKSWENSFENFIKDMGERPSKNHSIERINNELGYSKDNCKWATKKEQARNIRSNRIIEFNGIEKCLAEWAEIIGVSWQNLFYKLSISKNYELEKLLEGKKYDSV